MSVSSSSRDLLKHLAVDDLVRDVSEDQRLPDDEHGRLVEYLSDGFVVVDSAVWMPDQFDPDGEVISVQTLSDGNWVWSRAAAEYVKRHRFAVTEPFLYYLREIDFSRPELSEEEQAGLYECVFGKQFSR